MSCGKCPEFKEKFNEQKFKDKLKEEKEAPVPEPEPVKEDKRSWWDKLKDRIDPSGIGSLPSPLGLYTRGQFGHSC